jgi:hypothetical protein
VARLGQQALAAASRRRAPCAEPGWRVAWFEGGGGKHLSRLSLLRDLSLPLSLDLLRLSRRECLRRSSSGLRERLRRSLELDLQQHQRLRGSRWA